MYYVKYWQVVRRKGINQGRSVYKIERLEWQEVSLKSEVLNES